EIAGRAGAILEVHMEHATIERRSLHFPDVLAQKGRVGLVPAELDHFLAGCAGLSIRRGSLGVSGRLSSQHKEKQTKTVEEAQETHNGIESVSHRVLPFNPIATATPRTCCAGSMLKPRQKMICTDVWV